jgi:hypothetical protein
MQNISGAAAEEAGAAAVNMLLLRVEEAVKVLLSDEILRKLCLNIFEASFRAREQKNEIRMVQLQQLSCPQN